MSDPAAVFDEWMREHPELCRQVIVPAALKWEIRDKLDQANINERVLFPGLDGLSQWLARYYTPTGATLQDIERHAPATPARAAVRRRRAEARRALSTPRNIACTRIDPGARRASDRRHQCNSAK